MSDKTPMDKVPQEFKDNKIVKAVAAVVVVIAGALGIYGGQATPADSIITTETVIESTVNATSYTFRNDDRRQEHFEKHGVEMGFETAEEYEAAASRVVENKNSLHKYEEEDGDDVYYLESTNEFVIVSKDGYIRTYYLPRDGKAYFDRQ